MVDFVWNARSALQKAAVAGHLGAQARQPGIRLSEVRRFGLVQVMARRGNWPATVKAAKKHFGAAAPDRPGASFGPAATLVWSGPDQFMALSAATGHTGPLAPLVPVFAGVASLSDQSNGRCLIRISGARVRDALAKVSSLDLHEMAFPVGAAAATSIEHTAVNLWRETDLPDGLPLFSLLVFSSFAESVWHAITDAAAEYGVEVATSDLS